MGGEFPAYQVTGPASRHFPVPSRLLPGDFPPPSHRFPEPLFSLPVTAVSLQRRSPPLPGDFVSLPVTAVSLSYSFPVLPAAAVPLPGTLRFTVNQGVRHCFIARCLCFIATRRRLCRGRLPGDSRKSCFIATGFYFNATTIISLLPWKNRAMVVRNRGVS
jgi:hypothetical protein